MPIVKMPDGTQVRFPDEMPKEQIRALILQKFPDAGNPAPQQQPNDPNAQAAAAGLPVVDPNAPGADGNSPSPAFQNALAQLHAASSGIQKAPQEDVDRNVRANLEATKINNMKGPVKGLSDSADAAAGGAGFNFADELYSGLVGAPMRMLTEGTSYGEGYKRSQALQSALEKKRDPVANIVGQVGGGLATGGKLAQMGVTTAGRSIPLLSQAAPKTASTLLAGLEGAGYGGAYGLGQGEGMERIDNAITGAKIGGLTGGALQVGGNLLGSAAARKAAPATQTADDLAQQGRALYDQATSAGVTVKPQAINNAAGNVTMKLKSFGFDKDLQPKTAVVAKKLLEARNKTLDLAELDNIRKMASGISREQSAAASDRSAAGIIVDQIDNIINDTANFSAGSSQALEALKQGREVWKRKMKTETLEDIVEKAQNQATGFENGLVIQLRSLANNKTKMRAFSKSEQKMIKSVVRRGSIHGTIRALGMLAPNSTFGGLVTGGTLAGSGILPGVGLAAAGGLAKAGAGALTRGKVNALQRAVSTGQSPQLALPRNVNPFIGGATQATQGGYQLLSR